jgi:DNA-binding NarL/FixJ family response regulator
LAQRIAAGTNGRRATIRLVCSCNDSLVGLKSTLEQAGWEVRCGFDAPLDGEPEVRLGESLSCREVEVLQTLANVGIISAAAEALRLEKGTLHKHLRSIHEKFGAESTLKCVVLALRQGVIH